MINLGVNVLTGLTVVLIFPDGPFILKLTPKIPSPAFLLTKIFPKTGIFETNLFSVLAGTRVPFKFTMPVFFSIYPSICKETLVPRAKISSIVVKFESSVKLISKISKLMPRPDNKSAKPLKSAKVSKVAKAGAFITSKFSIVSFEAEPISSIMELYNSLPPLIPSKNL